MQRVALAILTTLPLLAACGKEPSELCAQLLEENAECLSADAAEECEAANDECPGRVVVLESCPVQFSCP